MTDLGIIMPSTGMPSGAQHKQGHRHLPAVTPCSMDGGCHPVAHQLHSQPPVGATSVRGYGGQMGGKEKWSRLGILREMELKTRGRRGGACCEWPW